MKTNTRVFGFIFCTSLAASFQSVAYGVIPPYMAQKAAEAHAAATPASTSVDVAMLEYLESALVSTQTKIDELQAKCDAKQKAGVCDSIKTSFQSLSERIQDLRQRVDAIATPEATDAEIATAINRDLSSCNGELNMLTSSIIRTGRICY